MNAVVIFGSNTGHKKQIIEEAAILLAAKTAGEITTTSSFYETEPWGFESPDLFLNRVIIYSTPLSPEDFLKKCLETEKELGRVRTGTARYASRLIDIDILFYDSLIIDTPDLAIPHPRLAERNFVLTPLNEIMPDFEHPVLHKKISGLFRNCPDKMSVKRLSDTHDLGSDSI